MTEPLTRVLGRTTGHRRHIAGAPVYCVRQRAAPWDGRPTGGARDETRDSNEDAGGDACSACRAGGSSCDRDRRLRQLQPKREQQPKPQPERGGTTTTVAGIPITSDPSLKAMLPASIVSANQIRVASDIPYPPWEYYVSATSKQVTGFDYDLSQALAPRSASLCRSWRLPLTASSWRSREAGAT